MATGRKRGMMIEIDSDIKCTNCFEKGDNNKNRELISKWVETEDFSIRDLMAIVCAKFARLPKVRSNSVTRITDTIQICDDRYNFIIAKVVNND